MKIHIRPAARADFEAIWLYSARTWGLEQADRYTDAINARIASIPEMPGIGSPVAGVPSAYRKLPSGSHRIIYRCIESEVIVVRILHEREDVPDEWEGSW